MFCQITPCDPESWWLTGFQHQIRNERRQLRWLNYGLSRQQSFSRTEKQMSAIYGPPLIMASGQKFQKRRELTTQRAPKTISTKFQYCGHVKHILSVKIRRNIIYGIAFFCKSCVSSGLFWNFCLSLNQSICIIPSISCWRSCTLQPGDRNEKKVRLLSFSSINLYNPFNFVFTQISVTTYRHYHNVSHVMYSWQSDIHLEGWNVEVLHAKLHMLLSFKRGNCEIKGLEHLGIISLLPSIGILTS